MSRARNIDGPDRGRYHSSGPCTGKIGYRSPALASREANRLQRENPKEHFSTYKCEECLDWHVGHSLGQNGRTQPRTDAPPEQPGEYDDLVIRQHHLQGVLSELNGSKPAGWQSKRRFLVGELEATVQRLREIKVERRNRAADPKKRDQDQWTEAERNHWRATGERPTRPAIQEAP